MQSHLRVCTLADPPRNTNRPILNRGPRAPARLSQCPWATGTGTRTVPDRRRAHASHGMPHGQRVHSGRQFTCSVCQLGPAPARPRIMTSARGAAQRPSVSLRSLSVRPPSSLGCSGCCGHLALLHVAIQLSKVTSPDHSQLETKFTPVHIGCDRWKE